MEGWLCEECEEYVKIPEDEMGIECPYCQEFVYNRDWKDTETDRCTECIAKYGTPNCECCAIDEELLANIY